ncbi:MAG: hypothetical protein H8D63_03145, partial [Parcubacteria group bacterium]|nr:hypothetical protein [Parcubacteria group bacterium]
MKNIIVGKQSKNIVLGSLIVGAFFFSFFVLDKNPVITEVHYSITPTTVEEVLAVSDLVVVGEVLKTKGVRVPSKIREGKMDILTDVTLKVDEVWFGEREGLNEVDFRVLGGKVEDEEMIVGESTFPEEGQKVLVFLKKNASDSESIVESLDAHYTLAARVHARHSPPLNTKTCGTLVTYGEII